MRGWTHGHGWRQTGVLALGALGLTASLLASAQAQQDQVQDQAQGQTPHQVRAQAEPRDQPPATSPSIAAFALKIEGPKAVSALLLQHLTLQRYKDLNDLDEAELQRLLVAADAQANELLATMGYFSPQLHWRNEASTHDGNQANPHAEALRSIVLTVEPGPQAVVQDVRITLLGDIALNPHNLAQGQALQSEWPLAAGETFTQARWSQAKVDLLQRLVTENYPLGQITDSQALVDAANHSVRLTLTLDSGPQVLLGPVEISGAERYGTDQALRLAQLPIGKPYRQSDLFEAQQRLVLSGFYDAVFISLADAGPAQALPVRIELQEVKRKKWLIGLGVRSDNGARLSAEHTHHRVPGLDWRAVTKLALDRNLQSLSLDLLGQPNERLWRWTTSAMLAHQQVNADTLNSERVRAGRSQLAERMDSTYYAQYDATRAVGSLPDHRESISANYAITWRRFDSLPFPSRGWGVGLEVGTGLSLGSDREPFVRWLAKLHAIEPLAQSGQRWVLRGELGGVLSRQANALPSTQLFRAGGDQSVRGYALNAIGIASAPGVVSAGPYLATGSLEWQIPIDIQQQRSDWEAAAFVDAGSVANAMSELKALVGVGVGVRWRSPVGPVQIDLARAMSSHTLRLHMNIGFKF